MKYSFQTGENANVISVLERSLNIKCISLEVFPGKQDGHKFESGQSVRLVGLTSIPQFNGTVVTISSIREDGPHGKAYYFTTDIKKLANELNWVYEYRLRAIQGGKS